MRVFLSYSRQDADFAGFFSAVLRLACPGVELWMDTRLEPGTRFPDEILGQVDRCDLFVAALSPAWAASDWCQRELVRAVAVGTPDRVVPLLVAPLPAPPALLSEYQALDLTRWRIEGDRVLRAGFFGRFDPRPSEPPPPSLTEAAREVVLWGARTATPPVVGRHLADLASWHAATAQGDPVARARLLDALAGLHLTRREWRDMDGATEAALALLVEAGWVLPVPGVELVAAGRSDDELGFLGELYNRLALGARQRGDAGGRQDLERALTTFSAIRQPLLRQERQAQVHRELGTWEQLAGNHAEARRHFRESARLLRDLPSQRFHVVQAAIKEAQVDLAEGHVEAARARLDEVAPNFAAGAPVDPFLAPQVLPHFLLTDAACAALEGRDAAAGVAGAGLPERAARAYPNSPG